jgi:hypothetical protein
MRRREEGNFSNSFLTAPGTYKIAGPVCQKNFSGCISNEFYRHPVKSEGHFI